MNPRAIRFAALSAMALGVSLTTAHGAAVLSGADTFGSGGNAFTIDFVDIGNVGNADDGGAGGGDYYAIQGGVSYGYRMGATEVPQDWITKATNLGMTNVTGDAWTGLQPAANMSWFEAAAFVNWLNMSTGHQPAYNLTVIPADSLGNTWSMALWSSAQAWQLDGENLFRHKDAYYFLPSYDEWYKAAYHKNDGVTANYWDYATASNTLPTGVASGTAAGTAVFSQDGPAAVDNNGGLSAYGTRGQTGNVHEWQENARLGPNVDPSGQRGLRGGDYIIGEPFYQNSAIIYNSNPRSSTLTTVGLRVASVPEPSCAMLMLSGSLLALARRRRRSAANC